MSASTLTGIFAPGSPALLETLRTLVITPGRIAEPGATVRAEFTFSNVGGAAATGVRARFALPAGVEAVAGSDTVDDVPLPPGETFIASAGAPIADLEPNASRRISIQYRIHDTIEDATVLAFQAAVVSDQLAVTASNVATLTVRAKPVLQNASTLVTIVAPPEPKPGDQLTIRATIVNTGASSAHDVVAMLPVPDHTAYVARTARVGGRPIPDGDGEPFDYDSATIVAPRLAPGASVSVEYLAAIESPLADATRIKVSGAVASHEVAEFAIASAEIVVTSPVDFNDDETGMTVFSDDSVTPGTRIAMSVRAANHGTGPAQNVTVTFDLPDGLIYSPGSAMIDGQPVGDEAFGDGMVTLGTVPAERSIEVGISAVVGVPPEGEFPLPIGSTLRWKGGERRFTRRLSVRATPRFARARNYIEVNRRVAQAEEDVDFAIHLLNDGTAAERHAQLRILPGAFVGALRLVDAGGNETPYDAPVALDDLEPHAERIITVRARVVPPVPDRSTVTLSAVLEQQDRAIDLGVGSLVVRSRPLVESSSCGWELQTPQRVHPGQSADIVIRFTNSGADTLRDAHVVLDIPKELAVERAQNARREHNTLYFGDVAAKTTHEARVTLRLLRARSGEGTASLEAVLYGRGISAIAFAPLEMPTLAEPEFEAGAKLHSTPHETVNTGERIAYDLALRNTGDGPADQLIVRVVPSNLAVYVPGSTTVNGMNVTDDVGMSVLWSQRGLVLTEIDPGVDLRIRWEMIAVSPLAAGTPVDARAMLEWDGGRSAALAAPTLHIQSTPSLAGTSSAGTISIAQTLPKTAQPPLEAAWQSAPEAAAPAPAPAPEPQAEPAVPEAVEAQTPPAAPIPPALVEVFERAQAALPPREPEPQRAEPVLAPPPEPAPIDAQIQPEPAVATGAPVGYVDFGAEKLSRTLRMLDKAELAGMLPHLFAIRTFFPENAINAPADVEKSFRVANRAIQNALDRLFVRLRIPRYSITAKDLEDRDSRFALRQLVSTLIATQAHGGGDGRAAGIVRMSGPIDIAALRSAQSDLESAPLGSAVPWHIAASMLGTTIARDGDETQALGAYRSALIDALATLRPLPLEEFHRVLRDTVNRTLDEALDNVLETLRAAAHIAVE